MGKYDDLSEASRLFAEANERYTKWYSKCPDELGSAEQWLCKNRKLLNKIADEYDKLADDYRIHINFDYVKKNEEKIRNSEEFVSVSLLDLVFDSRQKWYGLKYYYKYKEKYPVKWERDTCIGKHYGDRARVMYIYSKLFCPEYGKYLIIDPE